MKSMYDAIIDTIPEELIIDGVVTTPSGVIIKSAENTGLSEFRHSFEKYPVKETQNLLGMRLKKAAELIKSDNINEASIGHAAMNAYCNSYDVAVANGLPMTPRLRTEDRSADPFIANQKAARGKKVLVIGHFPYFKQLLGPVCELNIVGSMGDPGDNTQQEIERMIPGNDFIFMDVFTFVDKRLPRMLELAQGAFVGLVGPITTLSPVMFDYGVSELDGFVIKDPDGAEAALIAQNLRRIYKSGQKVSLRKIEYTEFLNSKKV